MYDNDFPLLFRRKEECVGCTACASACSKNAIVMEEDYEGFYYPVIIRDKCIGCGKCKEVCPMKDTVERGGTR